MQNHPSRLLTTIIVILVVTSLACSAKLSIDSATTSAVVTEASKNPLADLTAAAAAGKPLYAAQCALCHGEDGKGDGPAGTSLAAKPTDLTSYEMASSPDGKIFLVIKNGKMSEGKMTMAPVKRLKDEEVWQIVAYTRTLGKN